MLIAALLLFATAALLGAYMLTFALRDRHVPKGIALLHGTFAALGLVALIVHSTLAADAPLASLALFIVAAFGGGFVVVKDLRDGRAPARLALAHGMLAALAFALLLGYWWRGGG
jgi:hypothetical protein